MSLVKCSNCACSRDSTDDHIVIVQGLPYCSECAVALTECHSCGVRREPLFIDHDPVYGAQAFCRECQIDIAASRELIRISTYRTFGLLK